MDRRPTSCCSYLYAVGYSTLLREIDSLSPVTFFLGELRQEIYRYQNHRQISTCGSTRRILSWMERTPDPRRTIHSPIRRMDQHRGTCSCKMVNSDFCSVFGGYFYIHTPNLREIYLLFDRRLHHRWSPNQSVMSNEMLPGMLSGVWEKCWMISYNNTAIY